MPYYNHDPVIPRSEEPDEFEAIEALSGDESDNSLYEFQSGVFDPDSFGAVQQEIFQKLLELGVTAIRCTYEGGRGKEWALFERGIAGERVFGVTELAERFAEGSLGDIPSVASIRPISYFKKLSRRERAKEALDLFAFTLSLDLLGMAYGAGDFSMYGTFIADFTNATLIDQP